MARVEIGYSYGKIGMKDVYIQRGLGDKDYLRLGYFIPQFGIRGGPIGVTVILSCAETENRVEKEASNNKHANLCDFFIA